jgi:hypothetical protein
LIFQLHAGRAEQISANNGSVPNLYEMLIPAKERTKKFYIGREFDPVKVGLDTSGGCVPHGHVSAGDSNAGHSFEDGPRGNGVIGPLLSEEERWEIVEYLKSIPEEAAGLRRLADRRTPKRGMARGLIVELPRLVKTNPAIARTKKCQTT